jgi:O-antigen/teichoic acid export membrane protein
MINEDKKSYRQIIKATSIFGGVQVFNIFIKIIRSKVVAVLLGPEGMGIMGLLNSTISMVTFLTNFGLGSSAVKDISEAYSTGNHEKISKTVFVFRRLVWITGLLGLLVTLTLSNWLSQLTFGNSNYTIAFIWLSLTLLLSQLSNGQLVILQGMRKLKLLAKANLWGSALGLIITMPLYYFLRLDGIVPGIIGTSVITMLLSWFFSRKIAIDSVKMNFVNTIIKGKGMLQMGFFISLSGLLSMGVSYVVRIFINRTGSLEHVGLFNAGFAIINTYVGLIFTSMGTDYYPRLASVANDQYKCKQTINQQAEISILILAPILMVFLVFINYVILALYSQKFIPINGMIHWAALGIFFKAITWSIGFIFLAKGASKLFFWNELMANIYFLSFNLLGYHFGGLSGLGLSYLSVYLIYTCQVFMVSKIKFGFSFDRKFIKIFIIQFGLALLCFLFVNLVNKPYSYILGVLLIAISTCFSYKELDKRIEISNFIKRWLGKGKYNG